MAGRSAARKAKVTTAKEAYSIPASSRAASGATSRSSRAVARAGVASTTASACTRLVWWVEPTSRSHPPPATRVIVRTVLSVRTWSAAAATTA